MVGKDRNQPTINLGGKPDDLGRLLSRWIISIGRIIIVGTEFALLIALIVRFSLDFQLSNLHDLITKSEGYLSQLQKEEIKFRDIQIRLSNIKTYSAELKSKMDVFNNIQDQVQNDQFSIKRLALTAKSITIEGESTSVFALDDLVKKLKAINIVETINLAEIKSDESKLKFTINAILR